MKCGRCAKDCPDGAKKCPGCGVALVMPDEIDLMPEEPKKESGEQFLPPGVGNDPGAGGGGAPGEPPGRGKRKSLQNRGASANVNAQGCGKGPMMIGGAIALLLVVGLGFALFAPKNEVKGRAKVEQVIPLTPGRVRLDNFEVVGTIPYSLEVEVLEGEVLMGVAKRHPKDSVSPAALKKLTPPLILVAAGQSDQMKGELQTGHYSSILLNDTKKPAKVKVKFLAGDGGDR